MSDVKTRPRILLAFFSFFFDRNFLLWYKRPTHPNMRDLESTKLYCLGKDFCNLLGPHAFKVVWGKMTV